MEMPGSVPVRSRPRGAGPVIRGGPVELTVEMILRACADLTAACEASWLLVDEAVGAGRLPFCKLPGAFYLIAQRAARRAGTYKEFRAKLPKNFKCRVPDFYVAAPLPVELIDTLMQFADVQRSVTFRATNIEQQQQTRLRAEESYCQPCRVIGQVKEITREI